METIVSPVHLYCVGTLGHNGGVPANQVLFSYASPSRALAPASVSAATTTVLIAVVAPVVPPGPVMVAVAIRDVSGSAVINYGSRPLVIIIPTRWRGPSTTVIVVVAAWGRGPAPSTVRRPFVAVGRTFVAVTSLITVITARIAVGAPLK